MREKTKSLHYILSPPKPKLDHKSTKVTFLICLSIQFIFMPCLILYSSLLSSLYLCLASRFSLIICIWGEHLFLLWSNFKTIFLIVKGIYSIFSMNENFREIKIILIRLRINYKLYENSNLCIHTLLYYLIIYIIRISIYLKTVLQDKLSDTQCVCAKFCMRYHMLWKLHHLSLHKKRLRKQARLNKSLYQYIAYLICIYHWHNYCNVLFFQQDLMQEIKSHQRDVDRFSDDAQTLQQMTGEGRVGTSNSQLTSRYQSLQQAIKVR